MKAIQLHNGTSEKAKHFVIVQTDNMETIAYQVDNISGSRSMSGIPLGTLGDIDELEVQGQIAQKLLMP